MDPPSPQRKLVTEHTVAHARTAMLRQERIGIFFAYGFGASSLLLIVETKDSFGS